MTDSLYIVMPSNLDQSPDVLQAESRQAILEASVCSAVNLVDVSSLWNIMELLPSDTESCNVMPEGKFWLIGPSPDTGLCLVVHADSNRPIMRGLVTIHRYADLVQAGFSPLRMIAEVQR